MGDFSGLRELSLILEQFFNSLNSRQARGRGGVLRSIGHAVDSATAEDSTEVLLVTSGTYKWGPDPDELTWSEGTWS